MGGRGTMSMLHETAQKTLHKEEYGDGYRKKQDTE